MRITDFNPLGLGGDALEALYIFSCGEISTNRLMNSGSDLTISSCSFRAQKMCLKGGYLSKCNPKKCSR